jgi:glycosyltransferase involved in cell wall biosynthesis
MVRIVTQTLLFIIGDLDTGGAERHLVQVLPRLARDRFRPVVYTLSHKGVLAPLLENAGIPVIAPPGSAWLRRWPGPLGRRGLLLVISMTRLIILMRSQRPSVVHFFLPEAYVAGGLCALAAGCPTRIMSRRSLNVYQAQRPLAARVERWLHRRMTAVLGNSTAVIGELRAEGVAEDRLGLLYSGVDLSAFTGTPANDGGNLNMVVVANLIPYKGHADLLDALGGIRDKMPEGWVLNCVGRDGGYGEALRARAATLGIADNVHWLGERDDVPAILGQAHLGILCSHQEGFSNSIIEAMAAGLPMVVTDVGGNREAVIDEATGLVVPSHDPTALGAAILALALDPDRCGAMGAAARERARDIFSMETCVAEYEHLYDGLVIGDIRPVADILQRT